MRSVGSATTDEARAAPTRVKVSVTVDPALLKAVDSFVAQHPGQDRSKVFDAALYRWYAEQEELALEEQFSGPQSESEQEERADWRRIQRATAERIFGRPE